MSSAPRSLCIHLGYDPELVQALPLHQRRDLDSLSQAWLVAAAVLAYPLAVAVWMIEHSLVLSAATALSVLAFVVNLLRLLSAGSGAAPEHRWSPQYRPSSLPLGIFFGFALLMSQPAQLLHATDEARAQVRAHREELLESHHAALAALRQSGVVESAGEAFIHKLERCEFVVLRLKLLWSAPERALVWTILYVAIVLTPLLLARSLWLPSVRAYEELRHTRGRRAARAIGRKTRQQVRAALSRFPTYRPDALSPVGPPLRRLQPEAPESEA